MTTIRNTITDSIGDIPRGYSGYVDRAVRALELREAAITERLADYATGRGISIEEVNDLFVQVGFFEPTPEPTVETPAEGEGSRLDRIEASLQQLVGLANRHLGANL